VPEVDPVDAIPCQDFQKLLIKIIKQLIKLEKNKRHDNE